MLLCELIKGRSTCSDKYCSGSTPMHLWSTYMWLVIYVVLDAILKSATESNTSSRVAILAFLNKSEAFSCFWRLDCRSKSANSDIADLCDRDMNKIKPSSLLYPGHARLIRTGQTKCKPPLALIHVSVVSSYLTVDIRSELWPLHSDDFGSKLRPTRSIHPSTSCEKIWLGPNEPWNELNSCSRRRSAVEFRHPNFMDQLAALTCTAVISSINTQQLGVRRN
jgi:hypothetical protein